MDLIEFTGFFETLCRACGHSQVQHSDGQCICGCGRYVDLDEDRAGGFKRDTAGRYDYYTNLERLCVCGHTLGVHTGGSPKDCLAGTGVTDDPIPGGPQCDCVRFRLSRKKAEGRIVTGRVDPEAAKRGKYAARCDACNAILEPGGLSWRDEDANEWLCTGCANQRSEKYGHEEYLGWKKEHGIE